MMHCNEERKVREQMINEELRRKVADLVVRRKKAGFTQLNISDMTGVSRSNIANFERGIINNMYLYDFYITKFGGINDGKTAK